MTLKPRSALWLAMFVFAARTVKSVLAIGVLIGLLVLAPSALKKTFKASSQRKRINALEHEVSEHKAKVAELQRPVPTPSLPETQQPSQSSKEEGDWD